MFAFSTARLSNQYCGLASYSPTLTEGELQVQLNRNGQGPSEIARMISRTTKEISDRVVRQEGSSSRDTSNIALHTFQAIRNLPDIATSGCHGKEPHLRSRERVKGAERGLRPLERI